MPMYRPLTAAKLSVPFDSFVDVVSPATYATVVPHSGEHDPSDGNDPCRLLREYIHDSPLEMHA
ncbi:hypothetical protein [Streptomyces sp. NPDC017529]|uniref:hypothetical protein n=1 Tax=Streptomyces sp. NPDC017529 TaxID=3365000 RepID=UPI0037B4EAB7